MASLQCQRWLSCRNKAVIYTNIMTWKRHLQYCRLLCETTCHEWMPLSMTQPHILSFSGFCLFSGYIQRKNAFYNRDDTQK